MADQLTANGTTKTSINNFTIKDLDTALDKLDDIITKLEEDGQENSIRYQKRLETRRKFVEARRKLLNYYNKNKPKNPELHASYKKTLTLAKAGVKDPKIAGYNLMDKIENRRGFIIGVGCSTTALLAAESATRGITKLLGNERGIAKLLSEALKSFFQNNPAIAGFFTAALSTAALTAILANAPKVRRAWQRGTERKSQIMRDKDDFSRDINENLENSSESLKFGKALAEKSLENNELDYIIDHPEIKKVLTNLAAGQTVNGVTLSPTQRAYLKNSLENELPKRRQALNLEKEAENVATSSEKEANIDLPTKEQITAAKENYEKAKEAFENKFFTSKVATKLKGRGINIYSQSQITEARDKMKEALANAQVSSNEDYIKYHKISEQILKSLQTIENDGAKKPDGTYISIEAAYKNRDNKISDTIENYSELNKILDNFHTGINLEEDQITSIAELYGEKKEEVIKTFKTFKDTLAKVQDYIADPKKPLTENDQKDFKESYLRLKQLKVSEQLANKQNDIAKTIKNAWNAEKSGGFKLGKIQIGGIDISVSQEQIETYYNECKGKTTKTDAEEKFIEAYDNYLEKAKSKEKFFENDDNKKMYNNSLENDSTYKGAKKTYEDFLKQIGIENADEATEEIIKQKLEEKKNEAAGKEKGAE